MRFLLFLIFILLSFVPPQIENIEPIVMRHEDGVSGAYWSEDGNHILSWSSNLSDNTVRIWDLDNGTYRISGPFWERGKYDFTGINRVEWSPDEQHYLVGVTPVHTCQPRCGYQVWVDGRMLADQNNHGRWNPDNRRLITWFSNHLPRETVPLRVYDIETWEEIGSLSHFQAVQDAVWSSDGESVLYLAYRFDDTANLGEYYAGRWIPSDKEPIEEITISADVRWVSWQPSDTLRDTLIITSPYGYDIYPHCTSQSTSLDCTSTIKFAGHEDFITLTGAESLYRPSQTTLSPSGQWVAAATVYMSDTCERGDCPAVFIWNMNEPDKPVFAMYSGDQFRDIVWSPDESRLLTWHSDYEYCVDDICGTQLKVFNTQAELELVLPHDGKIADAIWSDDGKYILSESNYQRDCELDCYSAVHLWNAQNGNIVFEYQVEDKYIDSVIWHEKDGELLIASGTKIFIYNLYQPDNPMVLEGHFSRVNSVIWRDDEVLSWSSDGTLRYWDLSGVTEPYTMGEMQWFIEENTEEGYTTFRAHHDNVWGVQFNEDESLLLSWAGSDMSVVVWHMTGQQDPLVLDHYERGTYNFISDAYWLDNTRFLIDYRGIEIWDANTTVADYEYLTRGEYLHQFEQYSYAFDDDYGGVVKLKSLDGTQPDIRLGHSDGYTNVRAFFLNGGQWVVTSGQELTKVWSISEPANPTLLGEWDSYMIQTSFSPNEQYALSRDDTKIEVLELPTLNVVYSRQLNSPAYNVQWSNDSQHLLFISNSGDNCAETDSCQYSAWIVYPFSDREPLEFPHDEGISRANWLADETLIYTISKSDVDNSNQMYIWDAMTGELLHTFSYEQDVWGATWNKGRLVIWTGREAYLYDGVMDESPRIFEHTGFIGGVLFNSSGNRLVVWTGGNYMYNSEYADIRVWKLD